MAGSQEAAGDASAVSAAHAALAAAKRANIVKNLDTWLKRGRFGAEQHLHYHDVGIGEEDRMEIRKKSGLIVAIAVLSLAVGCARKGSINLLVGDEGGDGQLNKVPPDTFIPDFTPTPTPTPKQVVHTLKPVLAVRAMGCITCHAKIKSNIVTDFGFGGDGKGHDYFFGVGSDYDDPCDNFTSAELSVEPTCAINWPFHPHMGEPYGDHGAMWSQDKVTGLWHWSTTFSWAGASIWGTIFAPPAPIAMKMLSQLSSDTNLVDYLRDQTQAQNDPNDPSRNSPDPDISEVESVYIGAPTTERITAVSKPLTWKNSSWAFKKSSKNSTDFSGLELMPEGYLRNIAGSVLVCSGDLVVKEPLFLDHLQLLTDDGGCRIYSTKSVFIRGTITYQGLAESRNLQISSSRGIFLGLGFSPDKKIFTVTGYGDPRPTKQNCIDDPEDPDDNGDPSLCDTSSLHYRLDKHAVAPNYYTRESGPSPKTTTSAAILADSVSITGLWDSVFAQNGIGNNLNRVVNFERLLLNAPHVQSRYTGAFKGVVIAEIALFSLSNFNFEFDEVFSEVPVLPLLNESDYLKITE